MTMGATGENIGAKTLADYRRGISDQLDGVADELAREDEKMGRVLDSSLQTVASFSTKVFAKQLGKLNTSTSLKSAENRRNFFSILKDVSYLNKKMLINQRKQVEVSVQEKQNNLKLNFQGLKRCSQFKFLKLTNYPLISSLMQQVQVENDMTRPNGSTVESLDLLLKDFVKKQIKFKNDARKNYEKIRLNNIALLNAMPAESLWKKLNASQEGEPKTHFIKTVVIDENISSYFMSNLKLVRKTNFSFRSNELAHEYNPEASLMPEWVGNPFLSKGATWAMEKFLPFSENADLKSLNTLLEKLNFNCDKQEGEVTEYTPVCSFNSAINELALKGEDFEEKLGYLEEFNSQIETALISFKKELNPSIALNVTQGSMWAESPVKGVKAILNPGFANLGNLSAELGSSIDESTEGLANLSEVLGESMKPLDGLNEAQVDFKKNIGDFSGAAESLKNVLSPFTQSSGESDSSSKNEKVGQFKETLKTLFNSFSDGQDSENKGMEAFAKFFRNLGTNLLDGFCGFKDFLNRVPEKIGEKGLAGKKFSIKSNEIYFENESEWQIENKNSYFCSNNVSDIGDDGKPVNEIPISKLAILFDRFANESTRNGKGLQQILRGLISNTISQVLKEYLPNNKIFLSNNNSKVRPNFENIPLINGLGSPGVKSMYWINARPLKPAFNNNFEPQRVFSGFENNMNHELADFYKFQSLKNSEMALNEYAESKKRRFGKVQIDLLLKSKSPKEMKKAIYPKGDELADVYCGHAVAAGI